MKQLLIALTVSSFSLVASAQMSHHVVSCSKQTANGLIRVNVSLTVDDQVQATLTKSPDPRISGEVLGVITPIEETSVIGPGGT